MMTVNDKNEKMIDGSALVSLLLAKALPLVC